MRLCNIVLVGLIVLEIICFLICWIAEEWLKIFVFLFLGDLIVILILRVVLGGRFLVKFCVFRIINFWWFLFGKLIWCLVYCLVKVIYFVNFNLNLGV